MSPKLAVNSVYIPGKFFGVLETRNLTIDASLFLGFDLLLVFATLGALERALKGLKVAKSEPKVSGSVK